MFISLLHEDCLKLRTKARKIVTSVKEYYEIVGESCPLSAFLPKHADSFTEMHF